jgi:cell division protein ZapA (FtsZ GTPase activity inhibitor)
MTTAEATTNITVLIGGRPYPLKIKEGDEAAIRQIVKEVNDKITLFQNAYAKKDRQDWLAMALLTYAVDFHKLQQVSPNPTANAATTSESTPDAALVARLARLNDLLAAALI